MDPFTHLSPPKIKPATASEGSEHTKMLFKNVLIKHNI